ncbi:Kinetochore protein SPC25 [Camponotus japonicus]
MPVKAKWPISDFSLVLENDDHRNSLLRELELFFRNFRLNVAAQIEKRLIYEKDCSNKKSVNTTKIAELQQKIDTIIFDIDAITLQEEVIDKKISNVIKSQDSVKNELEEAKKQKNALSSEILDLELEIEETRNKKCLQWDAIKRTYNMYKVRLDMHISLEEEKDHQYIKVAFFIHNKNTKDKYFVQLSHSSNCWKVERIEPKLKKEYFNELSSIENFSEQFKVLDITLFLYEIRSIFLKYYI